jgi:hypothetical protein
MGNEWLPSARLKQLCRDQRDRWRRGDKARVDAYFDLYPELRSDEKLALDFICSEYDLRKDHGESPALADYVVRFPKLAPQLEALFAVLDSIESEPSIDAGDQGTTTGVRSSIPPNAGSEDTVPTLSVEKSGVPTAGLVCYTRAARHNCCSGH